MRTAPCLLLQVALCLLSLCYSRPGVAKGQDKVDLWDQAKTVLDNRCVSCHACYSSPCQVDLSSPEGILRGGKNDPIYDGTRLTPQSPTRLFIDAQSPLEWHKKHGFYPVIGKDGHKELLMQAVLLGQKKGKVDPSFAYNQKNDQICPTKSNWQEYYKDHAHRGMPFGFAPLSTGETRTLQRWARANYPLPAISEKDILARYPKDLKKRITEFESYLNGATLKDRIVGRYLYEHLFLSHFYFESFPKTFFRVVRSRTAFPNSIDEIPTLRPYDDPQTTQFHYRLRPIKSTIMHKNHITFHWSPERQNRYRKLLNDGDWVSEPKSFPSYKPEIAANPLTSYIDMPVEGRYRFFLDNARYFSMTFIRGPVCEGQVALNVIRDHFFIGFIDPKYDISVQDKTFLKAAHETLRLPATGKSSPFKSYYFAYKKKQRKYLQLRAQRYAASDLGPMSAKSIWDGDGKDQDAALTVFRHFDNSSVIKGWTGGPAQTVWIMDYPIFQRMYYLLVAGFNVFGNVFHQSSTRMYMDNLRVESENNFLYLAPSPMRQHIRSLWYLGDEAKEELKDEHPLFSNQYASSISLKSKDPESIIPALQSLLFSQRYKTLFGRKPDEICCGKSDSKEKELRQLLTRLSRRNTSFASFMPEMTMITLQGQDKTPDRIVFLTKLTAHENVAFMFEEEERLIPSRDRLIAADDWVGSYPNLMMDFANLNAFKKFVFELETTTNAEQTQKILAKHGMTRDHPKIWEYLDRVQNRLQERFPVEYGRLDLSKYHNIFSESKKQ